MSQVKIELNNHYYWLLRIHFFFKVKPYFFSTMLIVRNLKNVGSEQQSNNVVCGKSGSQSQKAFLCESCSFVSDYLRPHGLYSPWNSPGQNTGVCLLYLLQGIFPTQGLNPGLPRCRWILYQLSHNTYTNTIISNTSTDKSIIDIF